MYILFKTTYPILILVYKCIVFSCRTENSQSLTVSLNICQKIMLLQSKSCGEKKMSKSKKDEKKKFFCPLAEGGGAKGLSGLSTKKNNFFCGFPKRGWKEERFIVLGEQYIE